MSTGNTAASTVTPALPSNNSAIASQCGAT